MKTDTFNALWPELESASDKGLARAIKHAAEKYDELMLEHELVPDEGFDFLLQVLSSSRVAKARGIEHFLLEVNVDFCKYTADQQTRLLRSLIVNAGCFADELGRHSIGDLIARAYPAQVAFNALEGLAQGSPFEKHVAFVGLDVLAVQLPVESPLYKSVDKRWRELMNT